jgi:26S proteasome regulatory subunit N1
MVASEDESDDMLDFCLKGAQDDMHTWGHEYLRTLAGQITITYAKRVEKGESTDDLSKLVDIIIPHFIDCHEEPEAVDLLMETENLAKLNHFCNEKNFDRVCRYLCACSQYAADTDEMSLSYRTAFNIYKTQRQYCDAMRVAQKMNNIELIKEIMEACPDDLVQK